MSVIGAEVIDDDERRRHVDEAWADAVQQTVSDEQPLGLVDERRPDTADGQYGDTQQPAGTVAARRSQRAYEADGQRGACQRHAERQRPNPVWNTLTTTRHYVMYIVVWR